MSQQYCIETTSPASTALGGPLAARLDGATGSEITANISPGSISPSPPIANRGAEMTIPLENTSLIDWLAFTLKVDDPHDAIRIIGLSPDLFTAFPRGFSGYRKSLRCGNIAVFYEGQKDMGCHIEMSGQGCRQYEGLEAIPWLELFQKLLTVGANVTRLDLALDTVDGSLPLDKFYHAVRQGDVRTLFSEWRRIKKGSFRAEDSNEGETLYLGSPRSSTFFRVYNKAQEAGVEGSWIRFELELRKQRSQEAARLLGGGMMAGSLATGIINQYFAVVQRDDSNISRCPLQPWWANWLLTTEKISLGSAPVSKSIDDTMAFIKKQYAPSLAMIHQHLGGQTFNGYLQDVLSDGNERMNARHEKMLKDSKAKKALKVGRLDNKPGEFA